jgi:hypothetical protein
MEVLGEIDLLVDDRFTFNREVIRRIERVDKHIHVLAREFVLFEPVSEPLDVVGDKETIQAVDDLAFEITHQVLVRQHQTNNPLIRE